MDFILGLPDILRNFLDTFVKMLRDAEKTLEEVDVSMALTEELQTCTVNPISNEVKDGSSTNMRENEVRLWSNGQSTEAPEELETPEPSHFGPVLQFMEIPYEEARAEYFEILDSHIGEMLKDSKGFKDLLNSELALGWFVPIEWVGINGFPPLDLVVRDSSIKCS